MHAACSLTRLYTHMHSTHLACHGTSHPSFPPLGSTAHITSNPACCRHTEDKDLHSVNYLHYGAPKSWYCIPPAHRARFELLLKGFLPDMFRACPEFLRHKVPLQPCQLCQPEGLGAELLRLGSTACTAQMGRTVLTDVGGQGLLMSVWPP